MDELQLEGAASAEICVVRQHWGPWGEGVKVNCCSIPQKLLSPEPVAKLTAAGDHRKGFLDF